MESKFEELCKDFDRRRPSASPPAKLTFWFEVKWENEWDSVNDLLRRFLLDNAMEYLTFNGDVWFIRDGNWCRCDYDVNGDAVRFYLCEFGKKEV